MTLFYPSMAMLVCIFMATLLVAPLQSAEGSYVDKPVCDVCSCFNSDVICRTHLPTPARWKDLDEKWTEVKITEMDDLTKLEKGAFDGLTVRRLHIYENPDLESIEAGTFTGLKIKALNGFFNMQITLNPKLSKIENGAFEDCVSNGVIGNMGINRDDNALYGGLIIYGNKALSTIQKGMLKGSKMRKIQIGGGAQE